MYTAMQGRGIEQKVMTLKIDVDTSTNEGNSNIYIYVLVSLFLVLLCGAGVLWISRHKLKTIQTNIRNLETSLEQNFYIGAVDKINPDLNVALQADLLPFSSEWEFPVENLKLGKMLGDGAFGRVFKAEAFGILEDGKTTTVAVKTLPTTAECLHLQALKSELKILGHLGRHLNVVNLLGACTKQFAKTRNLFVIIDFCKFGCLRNFLIDNRKSFINNATVMNDISSSSSGYGTASTNTSNRDSVYELNHYEGDYKKQEVKPLETEDILIWAFQIASGMEYLESRNVLHGDLAARNILLAEQNVVKICDFGLSKQLSRTYNYNYKKCLENDLLPYKWMAIESMKFGLLSAQSDCWAFGVVLWELFSLGDSPYPGMEIDAKFIEDISNGYRMDKPLYAPSRLYDIMLQCWSENPNLRPTFSTLAETLGKMLTPEIRNYYAQLNLDFQSQDGPKASTTTDYLLIMSGSKVQYQVTDEYLIPLGKDTVYYKKTEGTSQDTTTEDDSNSILLPKHRKKQSDERIYVNIHNQSCVASSDATKGSVYKPKPIQTRYNLVEVFSDEV